MKAIRVHEFGPPETMKLETVADLEPGPGQVVVSLCAIGVNPVDAYIRSGTYRPDLPRPYTPGLDGAGTLLALGPGVNKFHTGQRVYLTSALSGSYAETVLCQETHVFPLPDQTSCPQGAALGVPYGTAYRALFQRARATPGETVLIHGASGGVGLAAVQLARAAGLRVIGSAGSQEGLELVRQQGAHLVLNHKEAGHLEAAMKSTEGKGVDVVLEMRADVHLGKDLVLLAKGGRVVVIGSHGPVEIDPRETMGRDAAILGMSLFNISSEELAHAHAAIGAGLDQGTLCPVVSREFPLAEAATAHHAILESHSLGKIILSP
jgi:NADPH:quinone reductase